ncbi:hypothetical protein CRG98_044936 [Punica granatum]|uniref:CCHC-type domain-containing protein n=1 Tax=Punica granatum TaxID=22663 RepID=A0A2I0HTS7_PUNGR|nr:hypothetical protein CRG98_044936 [Punica granatum]
MSKNTGNSNTVTPGEYKVYLDLPALTCDTSAQIATRKEKENVGQFPISLNLEFSTIRSQILNMDPLPNVNRAHSMVGHDEAQRLIAQGRDSSSQVMGFAAKVAIDSECNNPNFSSNRGDFKPRGCPFYNSCGQNGHHRATCYELHDAWRREFRVRFIQLRAIGQVLFGRPIPDASSPIESWAVEAYSIGPTFFFPESNRPSSGPGPGSLRTDSRPQQISKSL